jgi:transposase-like protein
MIPLELLEDYLIDQDDGLKKLLTWFLNLVMQLEAIQQSDAEPYQRIDSRKAHRNGYKRAISEDTSWRNQTQETSISGNLIRDQSF